MKSILLAAALTAPAMAQTAAHTPLSVQTSPIGDILRNPGAKAVVDKELPGLKPFYGAIGKMTLIQISKSSHGAVGEDKLQTIQAEFNKLP